MKTAILTSLILIQAICSGAAAIRLTFQKALAARDLSISVTSCGGYCGEGLQLTVSNNSANKEYVVDVPTGLIFRPADVQYQPLAIAGAHEMIVKPGCLDTQTLHTFCARSSANSPARDINYTFLMMAPPPLARVLAYIQAHHFLDYTGQHAVWAMTDDHAPAGVYDYRRPEESKKFAAFVAKQKGVEAPDFYYVYKEHAAANNAPVFVPVPTVAVVELEWNEKDARLMTCEVVREDGTIYRDVPGPEFITAGGQHRMHTVFDLATTPPGVYYVRARDEMNRVWKQHKVTIG